MPNRNRKKNHNLLGLPSGRGSSDGINRPRLDFQPSRILVASAVDLPGVLHPVVASLSVLKDLDDTALANSMLKLQDEVIYFTLKRVLNDQRPGIDAEPKDLQMVVLKRLIFAQVETILVAQTGFGKSLIFQTFTLLTGKITIQVIPLVALGQQQLLDTEAIPGAKPCLITAETKALDSGIFRKILALEYTHILLGPEQLLSTEFQDILVNSSFRRQVGLIAIDEAHCISMWSSFRAEYASLHRIRALLPRTAVLFACTATMDPYTEGRIVKDAGFQYFGSWNTRDGIIRMSVDRPDIALVIVQLPSRNQREALTFILNDASKPGGEDNDPSPQNIKKTIIFGNSIKDVSTICKDFRSILLRQHQYSHKQCTDVVRIFTSRTPQIDRDSVLSGFRRPDSKIRILVATTAFGMGLDIPDVEVVVQFKAIKAGRQSQPTGTQLEIQNSLSTICCDLWQRIGRAARGSSIRGIAYICLESNLWSDQRKRNQ